MGLCRLKGALGALGLALFDVGCVELQPRTRRDAQVVASDAPADASDAASEDAADVPTSVDAAPPDGSSDAAAVDDHVDAAAVDDHVDAAEVTDAAALLDVTLDAGGDVADVIAADRVDVVDAVDVIDAAAGSDAAGLLDVGVGSDAGVDPFPSTGADGEFPGTRMGAEIELEPRVWNFTRINVPQGMVLRAERGAGVLELRATGDVIINGRIDLSGGPGGNALTGLNLVALGGDSAYPHAARDASGACTAPEQRGRGGSGAAGGGTGCAQGGAYGGGNSGTGDGNNGGGGGGGHGGGGGGRGHLFTGTTPQEISTQSGGNGGGGGEAGIGGRGAISATGGGSSLVSGPLERYAGAGPSDASGCLRSSGAGGSIGAPAAADLPVRATLRPGSGGGGGGGWFNGTSRAFGGGGGGGGGALRIASPTRITLGASGELLANGGAGGGSVATSTLPNAGGGGGGGSGGVIYLSAPQIDLRGVVRAEGGAGGEVRAMCGSNRGGAGGSGRLRLSVDPARCMVTGSSSPPVSMGCGVSADGGVPGQAYVGAWPN